ncbi:MAG: formate dehydrogenase accessory sulfurtransferase FdhD [Actinobacteria bacterium]|nr:formate dehydrogenase accessory sulfurtransferase FdhD [Actinomycetota bacterium]
MAVAVERKVFEAGLSKERSIHIFLNNVPVAISQGTPSNVSELAVGYLLSEGLLSNRSEFKTVVASPDGTSVHVESNESIAHGYTVKERVTSSGCAKSALLCDKGEGLNKVSAEKRFLSDDLLAMMEELCTKSPKRNTGECVHGCGIGNDGRLACVREDIGRHNAMDKLLGQAWLDCLSCGDMALFTTGRISYEMALKAAQAGVGVFVSRKGVTDTAAELANSIGLTLVSYCRDNSMMVLTHHQRVI